MDSLKIDIYKLLCIKLMLPVRRFITGYYSLYYLHSGRKDLGKPLLGLDSGYESFGISWKRSLRAGSTCLYNRRWCRSNFLRRSESNLSGSLGGFGRETGLGF